MPTYTPESTIANRYSMGSALLGQAAQGTPSLSPYAPLANVLQGITGGLHANAARGAETSNQQIRQDAISGMPFGDQGAMARHLLGQPDPELQMLGLKMGTSQPSDLDRRLTEAKIKKAEAEASGDGMTASQRANLAFKEQEAARKRAEKAEGAANQKNVLVSEMERLKATASDLKEHKGLAGSVGGYEFMGVETPYPAADVMTKAGSPEADFEAKFENLKSQVGFNVLQAMRQASKTGGALGSIAVAELTMLQNNLAALDPKQGDAQFKAELGRIVEYADDVIGRLNAIDAGGGSDTGGSAQEINPADVIDNGDGTGTLPDGRTVRWVE